MTARARFTPQAEQDLLDQATYLAENASLEVADRFFEAASRSADHLAGMPRMGRLWKGRLWKGRRPETRESIRMWGIDGFPAVLFFYRVEASGITVVRVLHDARDLPPLVEDLGS